MFASLGSLCSSGEPAEVSAEDCMGSSCWGCNKSTGLNCVRELRSCQHLALMDMK